VLLAVVFKRVLPDGAFHQSKENIMTKPKKKQPDTTVPTIEVSPELVSQAVAEGRALIDQNKSKVEAAMMIYRLISDYPQQTVLQAFIDGASLTPKGALTYWYNCKRKIAKERKKAD
jgi:hypothetical protein